MGSWGPGIFEDDMAVDARSAFEFEIADGVGVREATQNVLNRFRHSMEDEDDGPVIYLALAALQIEHGALEADLKNRALHIIDTGQALEGWDELPDWPGLIERKQVLEEMRFQLLSH